MKKLVLIYGFLLLLLGICQSTFGYKNNENSFKETFHAYCSSNLYDLTTQWVDNFSIQNPEIAIEISKIDQDFSMDKAISETSLIFISEDILPSNYKQQYNLLALGREIIVPVMNSNNPLLNKITEQGVSAQDFAKAMQQGNQMDWNQILENVKSKKLEIVIPDNHNLVSMLTSFVGTDISKFELTKMLNEDEVCNFIQKTPGSIGFCKLSNVVGDDATFKYPNIKLLPIDRNNNGRLDYMEQIYTNIPVFTKSVWIGKYPKTLTKNIYALYNNKINNKASELLLEWLLSHGQEYLRDYGFNELALAEKQSGIYKIKESGNETISEIEEVVYLKPIIIFIGLVIILGLLIDLAFFRYNRRLTKQALLYGKQKIFSSEVAEMPSGFYYDKTHTWAFMEQNGLVKIGLGDFIPSVTGILTSVTLKLEGEQVTKGEYLFSIIQSGKRLDIKAPVSGKIVTKNDKVKQDASLINYSPYNKGWIYLIEPSNWAREIQFMLGVDKFKEWLQSEYMRFKDFLAIMQSQKSLQGAMVLQEGGELSKSVLEELEPEVWEDFQQHFIDALL